MVTNPITTNPFDLIYARLSNIESLLLDIKHAPFPNPKEAVIHDRTGGTELAEEITGLARATIYCLVSSRRIPHSKRGKKLYFSEKELLNWIKQGNRKTVSEIEEEAGQHLSNLKKNRK